jgi:hypothetical protein
MSAISPAYLNMMKTNQIHLINDETKCDLLFDTHKLGDQKIVGFDCEWRPTLGKDGKERRKISLIQIAISGHIFLIHTCSIGKVPPSLQQLLQDPCIIKTGVNCTQDAKFLFQDYGILAQNIVELGTATSSLRALTFSLLSVDLPKTKEIQCSNWENWPLGEAQVLYAAADAFYSVEIAITIAIATKGAISPPVLIEQVQSKGKRKRDHRCKLGKFERIREERSYEAPKKTASYDDNFQLLGSDGTLLRYSSEAHINNLLEQKLIEPIPDKEKIFRYLVTPDAASLVKMSKLYQGANKCVVCGVESVALYWWCVIPKQHRHYIKKYTNLVREAHDVVLTCAECRNRGWLYLQDFGNQFASSENDEKKTEYKIHKHKIDHLLGIARLLLNVEKTIPVTILDEKRKLLCQFYNKETMTEKEIQEVINTLENDKKIAARADIPHANGYLLTLSKTPDEFCKMWRKLFLEKMQPKFLHKESMAPLGA